MMLTRSFQKTLIAKAHSLKPVVQLGQNGLTPAVHDEIDVQLLKHELIKIKLNVQDKEAFDELVRLIPEKHQAFCIQSIGRTIVLYKENPNLSK
ncbi:MAG: YhbY family RNA-binding protein [Candidatus Berkiella sp.]